MSRSSGMAGAFQCSAPVASLLTAGQCRTGMPDGLCFQPSHPGWGFSICDQGRFLVVPVGPTFRFSV